MVEVGRDLGRSSGPTPCSSRAIYSQSPRTMFRWLLSICKDGDSTTSLGNLCQCLATLTVKKCFLIFRQSLLCFIFVPIAFGPVTGHHWKAPGSILFAPSLQVFQHFDKIPLSLLFSRQNSLSSLSLSSQETCSTACITLVALCSLQRVHGSLVLGSLALDPVLQMQPHQC